jgi:hypothetical protein
VELVAFRWADYDRPLRAHPHTGDARYTRSGSEPTQYWSLHPLGPWAEFLRATYVGPPVSLATIRQRVWAARFSFDADEIVEVTYEWAKGSGHVSPEDLVSDEYTGCQLFADWAREHHAALIVPSAALPGTRNLIVFGARAASPYQLPPVDPQLDVPSSVLAEHARPPAQLPSYVRFRGQPHPEFEAWIAGDPYIAPAPLGVPPATSVF